MPIPAPEGYISRAKVPEFYNRSQKSLETDINKALLSGDTVVLDAYVLVTKDGTKRNANEVSSELVDDLLKEGMIPTWFVKEDYLRNKFGPRGAPKPRSSDHISSEERHRLQSDQNTSTGEQVPKTEGDSTPKDKPEDYEINPSDLPESLPEALRQIRRMHLQIKDLRNDKRVQADQIKAWNERQKETNVLTKELHEFMNRMELGSGANEHDEKPPRAKQESTELTDVIDVTPTAPTTQAPVKNVDKKTAGPSRNIRKSRSPKKTTSPKTTPPPPRNKSSAPKRRPVKKSTSSKRKQPKPSPPKQKGFLARNLPTLFDRS